MNNNVIRKLPERERNLAQHHQHIKDLMRVSFQARHQLWEFLGDLESEHKFLKGIRSKTMCHDSLLDEARDFLTQINVDITKAIYKLGNKDET